MIYTGFYDQVLAELQSGKANEGINMLVGMLDVADLQEGGVNQARDELERHQLGTMLLHDPVLADAAEKPDDPTNRLRMLVSKETGSETISTGRMLFEATSELAIARALRNRQSCTDQKLARAWQTGQKICLFDQVGTGATSILGGRDQSNVTLISHHGTANVAQLITAADTPFDLILAPDLADCCDAESLSAVVAVMRAHISRGGSIVLAALVPQHPGSGWRSACLHWDPQCHSADALVQIATAQHLEAHAYQDATNCVNWIEMKLGGDDKTGGDDYGY